MSREKQIYETAKDLCQNGFCTLEEWNGCNLAVGEYCERCKRVAERLYNIGYRKHEQTPKKCPWCGQIHS